MAKVQPHAPAAKVELFEKLIATHPIAERKGAANPYTSHQGHMFSFLTRSGQLALRLGKEEHAAFTAKFKTKPVIVYDTVMKEYVGVPDALFKKTRDAAKYFAMSFDYVDSLEPKATKKTAKKKAKASKKKASKKAAAKKKTTKKKASKKAASKKKATKKAISKKKVTRKKATKKAASRKTKTRRKK